METRIFKKGEVIIEEGSYGICAYIIESGKVEVSTTVENNKLVLATLGEKEIFGEMGLIEDKPRSATIIALEDTELNVISRESFNSLFQKNPKVILPIVKALFERLRVATKMAATQAAKRSSSPSDTQDEQDGKVLDDKRSIVLSGTNDISRAALDGVEIDIKKFPFKVGRYTIGHSLFKGDASSQNDLYIREDSPPYYVSKNHFMIDKVDSNIVVIDRGSRLGVIVNSKLIKESCILKKEENEIIVGSSYSPFVFKVAIKDEGKLKNALKEPESIEKQYEEINGEDVSIARKEKGGAIRCFLSTSKRIQWFK